MFFYFRRKRGSAENLCIAEGNKKKRAIMERVFQAGEREGPRLLRE